MKKTLTAPLVAVLLLTLSAAAHGQSDVAKLRSAPTPVRHLTLTFELENLPGRDESGSLWQVSYQWKIADRREFDDWALGGGQGRQKSPGMLLSKDSFTRRNLSDSAQRRFSTSVPVVGELRERIRNAGQRQQIVWLEATVRIRDGKLGEDFVKNVNPAWGPYFYLEGDASLRMELTPTGFIRWQTNEAPPPNEGKADGVKRIRATPAP